jgi:hypothetical protein
MSPRWLLLMILPLAACNAPTPPAEAPATPAAPADTLDAIAADYVRLSLEIGEHEPGYIDAYYGPPDWAEQAKVAPREIPELRAAVDALAERVAAIPPTGLDALEQRRAPFLAAQLTAAATRLRMLAGEKLAFADEAEGLFAWRPQLRPLADYDAVLAEIERLAPGEGPLSDRVDALAARSAIPADRLDAVMRAAIDECRRRTAAHIALPAEEKFTLEFVTQQPWSGYNWYQGRARSLIQINTDFPILMSRAVDLGCHEGYPGHHVLNLLLEQKLARGRDWVEFTVYPLYSPQSFIAEGTANYGIELAFPGDERLAYERDVLYPLAGLDPSQAEADLALVRAKARIAGARLTIAQQYLDGLIDRDAAIALAQKYQLISRERAEQSIAFTDKYRSYVINYGLGLDLARAYVEGAGEDSAARWAAIEKVLSEPTLPADLVRR